MSDLENVNQPKKNPLAGWYRQPKLYVKLPSKGRFYPPGALDVSTNEEYPVYAMTAKDELLFKTPDALLTGASTVELIKSCIPAIKDPWLMPAIDLDFALIAIRIATYGEKMEIDSNCPYCNAENTYDIDLNNWMALFAAFEYRDMIEVDPLQIYIRPYTYQEVTKTQLKTLEQQKIFTIINDEKLTDEQKVDQFGKSFVKLTELTVEIVAECISRVVTPDGETTDKKIIKEFINNTSKDIFDQIQDRLKLLREQVELKAQNVQCGECKETFDIPITMDQSNFFVVKS